MEAFAHQGVCTSGRLHIASAREACICGLAAAAVLESSIVALFTMSRTVGAAPSDPCDLMPMATCRL